MRRQPQSRIEMSTDPINKDKPAYSENYTGLIEIDEETGLDAVALLGTIKSTLERAGWTQVGGGRLESTAQLEQVAAMMAVASIPTDARPPVEYTDACSRLIFPQWVMATVSSELGTQYFVAYDPYTYFEPP